VPFEIEFYGGNVANYPFDRYHGNLSVQCFANAPPLSGEAKPLPAEVRVWEAVLGFQLETREEPASNSAEVRLGFDIRRSGGFSLFALAAYAAMVVRGCTALTIGILAYTSVRRPDAPFVGALGAIVFALPALRTALPGARRWACARICSSSCGQRSPPSSRLRCSSRPGPATAPGRERRTVYTPSLTSPIRALWGT
jgi:hypothetical protein